LPLKTHRSGIPATGSLAISTMTRILESGVGRSKRRVELAQQGAEEILGRAKAADA
jgi:hypothetical protein